MLFTSEIDIQHVKLKFYIIFLEFKKSPFTLNTEAIVFHLT